jgi:hypothetical protein
MYRLFFLDSVGTVSAAVCYCTSYIADFLVSATLNTFTVCGFSCTIFNKFEKKVRTQCHRNFLFLFQKSSLVGFSIIGGIMIFL